MKNDETKDAKYWSERIKTQEDVEEFSKFMESLTPKFSNVQEKIEYVVSRDEVSRTLLQRIFGIGYPTATTIVQDMIIKKGVEETISQSGHKVISKKIVKEVLINHFL